MLRYIDEQTNKEYENREPTTFYFFLIFRTMLYFFLGTLIYQRI